VRCTCVTSKRAYLMHPENCFAVGDEVVSADARSLSCTRPSALQTTPAPFPVNWSFQERPEEFHERLRQIPMRWRSSLSSLMASMASGGSLDEHGRGAGSRAVGCGGTADMDIAGDRRPGVSRRQWQWWPSNTFAAVLLALLCVRGSSLDLGSTQGCLRPLPLTVSCPVFFAPPNGFRPLPPFQPSRSISLLYPRGILLRTKKLIIPPPGNTNGAT